MAVAQQLTAEQPTHFVRLLGENLVLFRDKLGRVGLIADRCVHRGVSLCYGRVEDRGISCAYHGWLYDTGGNILETPPERNDAIINSVKQTSYPVQKFSGLYWTYLGPQPAPLLAPYDLLARRDGRRQIVVHPMLDCNWFQAQENSVDPDHLQILHQEFLTRDNHQPVNTTRGFIDEVEMTDFYTTDYGIIKKRTYKDGRVDEHPLVFPNMLRQGFGMQIRVPGRRRAHHAFSGVLRAEPDRDHRTRRRPARRIPPGRTRTRRLGCTVHALHHGVGPGPGPHAMWETQGAVADRTIEHLSYTDRGVSLLRKVTQEQIEKVQRGEDPLGVFRAPADLIVDTNFEESVKVEGGGVPHGGGRATPPTGVAVAAAIATGPASVTSARGTAR